MEKRSEARWKGWEWGKEEENMVEQLQGCWMQWEKSQKVLSQVPGTWWEARIRSHITVITVLWSLFLLECPKLTIRLLSPKAHPCVALSKENGSLIRTWGWSYPSSSFLLRNIQRQQMQTFLMWSLKPRSQSRTALLKPEFFALLSRNREELV